MSVVESNVGSVALQTHILEHIPLARAMGLQVAEYTGDALVMTAPLAPNINDKGCAFGGSMASLLTLAGWGLIELALRARRLRCDIYIGDSQLRYREPVWGELRGVARCAEDGALEHLVAALGRRGKGHADVVCEIAGEHGAAAVLAARYVAKLHA